MNENQAIGSQSNQKKKSHKWLWIIIGIVLLLAVVGVAMYFLKDKVFPPEYKNTTKDSQKVIDISEQLKPAEDYPVGSVMWANIMINGALYASEHGGCKTATDTLDEVKQAKVNDADISARINEVRGQVDGNCR